MLCLNCGKEMEENAKFCSNCGKRMTHSRNKYKKNRKIEIKEVIFFIGLVIFIFSICFVFKKAHNEKANVKIYNGNGNVHRDISQKWQDDCLKTEVNHCFSFLYNEDGLDKTIDDYYNELTKSCNGTKNLYYNKFKEEFEKIEYESLEQIQKDILNGLIFSFAEGTSYYTFELPVEKAWLVGEGINNTNKQKHRKIVLKNAECSYAGLEINYWINSKNVEVYKASNCQFGDQKNDLTYDDYYGINDILSDSGVWGYYIPDNYNNEKYVSLDVTMVNNTIESNKSFLQFMKEYIDIYKKKEYKEKKEKKAKEDAIKSKKPSIGMTKSQVLDGAWGEPNKINKDTYSWGIQEQWVYDNGYVYFENGIVTSVSER